MHPIISDHWRAAGDKSLSLQLKWVHDVDLCAFQAEKGFFVECGALDGERSSNTAVLESEHHWQGSAQSSALSCVVCC